MTPFAFSPSNCTGVGLAGALDLKIFVVACHFGSLIVFYLFCARVAGFPPPGHCPLSGTGGGIRPQSVSIGTPLRRYPLSLAGFPGESQDVSLVHSCVR